MQRLKFGTFSGGKLAILIPPIKTVPVVGVSSLYNIFIKVDFPAPEAPVINTNSPDKISRLIFFKA